MFQLFRKHQKRWLTAVAIMAMIAFVFPIGTTYFTGPGERAGRGQEVVGTVYNRQVTKDDVNRARMERLIANSFFQVMMTSVQPELGLRLGGFELFGPTRDDDAIMDAIRLSHKADELGVRVSDDMVRGWIHRMTDGKLTNEQFDRVCATLGRVAPQWTGDGGLSPELIFDILKKQLRIERVRELVMGRFGDGPSPVTPFESWQFYQRLNDKLGLEVIPVHVAEFAAEVDDPGDSVLRDLYANHIDQLPDPASPDPGFREPHRVNLEYAVANLSDFTAAVKPQLEVTGEEIQQYYDSRKELYRVKPAGPTPAPSLPDNPAAPSDEKKESTGDQPADGDKPNDSDKPAPEEKKGEEKEPAAEQKSDDAKKPANDEKAERDDVKPDEPKKSDPGASDDKGSPADSKDSDSSSSDSPDSDAAVEKSSGPRVIDDQEPKSESQDSAQPKAQETPGEQDAKPQDAEKKTEPADKPADGDKPAGQDKTDSPAPAADEPKADPKPADETEAKKDEKKDEPQYKPIEEVSDEIRETLIKDKARAELIKRLGQLEKQVHDFARTYFLAKDQYEEAKESDPNLQFNPPEPPDFSKAAEELGLQLSQTGLVALDQDRFKLSNLGQATELEGGRTRGRSVADVMRTAESYDPRMFQNLLNDEYFTAWKIEDQPERSPAFDEIRDRVLLAYRMIQARDRAEERANKLAESLRELDGDIAKLREKEAAIESIKIPPMALWSNAPVFSMQMMSRPSRMPADLPGVHLASDELRDETFELKEGGVTVAPNEPKDIYYVVLLAKREPASREEFARSRQFIEMQIQAEQAEKLYRDWLAQLRRESSETAARAPAGN